MSRLRQEDESVLVRTFGVTFSGQPIFPPTSEAWDQLVYAAKGILRVRTEADTWVVPPYRAVWVPAGIPCSLEVSGQTALRMLYLRRSRIPSATPPRCAVLNISPLLRELILRAVNIGALQSHKAHHRRLAGLIHDELRVMDTVPLQLPYPKSEQARQFALLLENSDDRPFDVDEAVRSCGASRRTVERLFRAETNMSLGQWIRRRKLLQSLELLLKGETTASVAFQLGYNGPSAFIAMFKRELGTTPGTYISNANQG